jgi:hypothetical protein
MTDRAADAAPTPVVRRISTFPVKSLDACSRDEVRIVENGGLDGDREFALVDDGGDYVNGKRERAVHRIHSEFDPDARALTLWAPERRRRRFDVDDDADRDEMAAWLSAYFGYDVSLRQNRAGGYPDDTEASGPTVVSTATLREVASWFDDVDESGMRRRLRANVELGTADGDDPLPPFWEDRLFDEPGRVVDVRVGDVRLGGVNPCQRCVVPTRDPDTGESTPGFRETLTRRREETMPPWSGGDWFDHYYRLMVNTTVPESSWGETLRVGDEVELLGTRSAE